MFSSTCVYCRKEVSGPVDQEGWFAAQQAHIDRCSVEIRAELEELRAKFNTETENYYSRLDLRREIIRLRDDNAVRKDSQYAPELRAIIAAVRSHKEQCGKDTCAICVAVYQFDRRLIP